MRHDGKDALAQGMDILDPGDAHLQHRELVTPETGNEVGITDAAAKTLCAADQHLVTRGMAEAVIDCLEPVEIQTQHRGRLMVAATAHQRLLEPAQQHHAVRQTGERIMPREELELALGFDLRGDVGGCATVADQVPLRVKNRLAGHAQRPGLATVGVQQAKDVAERCGRPDAGRSAPALLWRRDVEGPGGGACPGHRWESVPWHLRSARKRR